MSCICGAVLQTDDATDKGGGQLVELADVISL